MLWYDVSCIRDAAAAAAAASTTASFYWTQDVERATPIHHTADVTGTSAQPAGVFNADAAAAAAAESAAMTGRRDTAAAFVSSVSQAHCAR